LLFDHGLSVDEEFAIDGVGPAGGVHMVEVEPLAVDDSVGLHEEFLEGGQVLVHRELALGRSRLVVLPAVREQQVHVRVVEDLAELCDREVARGSQHLLLALREPPEGQEPENCCEGEQFSIDQHVIWQHGQMQLLLFCQFNEGLNADSE
jgi:hypothetical protein